MQSNTEQQRVGQDTAIMLRKKYTARRAALQRFTERVQKGVVPDEAEKNALREVGVSESEIRELVVKLSAS